MNPKDPKQKEFSDHLTKLRAAVNVAELSYTDKKKRFKYEI